MPRKHHGIITATQHIPQYVLLDAARCVAVLLLLMSHISQTIENPFMSIWFVVSHLYRASLGELAVTIFLILSGLGLQLGYGGKISNYTSFWSSAV